jgi:hypothetical protein
MIGAEVDLRAAIFIDGGYLQTQLKIHNVDADYAELADFFLSPLRASFPLDLLRCYYYYCAPYMSPEPTEDELKRMETHKKFVQAIQSLGRWAIRLGKLQKRWEGVTLTLWCGHYNTVNNDLIALADEVYTFDWNEFPRTATEGGAQTDPQRYKRRRRRGGRGRRPTGGDSSESSSQDGGARAGGRSQGSPGVPGRVAAQAAQKDGPKTGWRDRLRRMAGLK